MAQERPAALAPLAEARNIELEFAGAHEALVDGEHGPGLRVTVRVAAAQ